jgi:UDP-N-acetylglucosamine diphosphorylase/glucosamine-1-phosphate N-acetyltransferase
MNILLFDHPEIRRSLLPLTFTRPVADIRLGIMTISEKWAHEFNHSVSCFTQDYLSTKYPAVIQEDNLYINGALCPDQQLLKKIGNLSTGSGLRQGDITIAFRSGPFDSPDELAGVVRQCDAYENSMTLIRNTWQLFLSNGDQIRADYQRMVSGRTSQPLLDPHTIVYNEDNIFIEEGVQIKASIINAENGPVYLGSNSEIQEGTIIQGPFALGNHAQLRLGGKMRPNTTVGPYCKIGGEVGNVIFQSNSNKAHEGFLGNCVIGSWCNLGADTNNSNLKNNYSNVRLWNYHEDEFVDTGLQFCGVIMGDHSKSSINTMFNTGTVVGVCANIHGAGFPAKFIPSFVWGGTETTAEYNFEKACGTAAKVMERRSLPLDEVERSILENIFQQTAEYRLPALT